MSKEGTVRLTSKKSSIVAVLLALSLGFVPMLGCASRGVTTVTEHASVATVSPAVVDHGMQQASVNRKKVALRLVRAYYNDWKFVYGEFRINPKNYVDRCSKYIEPYSSLYYEMRDSTTNFESRFAKTAATRIAKKPTAVKISDGVYRVTIHYNGTQNTGDREFYEQVKKNVYTDVWDVTVNSSGKATNMVPVR